MDESDYADIPSSRRSAPIEYREPSRDTAAGWWKRASPTSRATGLSMIYSLLRFTNDDARAGTGNYIIAIEDPRARRGPSWRSFFGYWVKGKARGWRTRRAIARSKCWESTSWSLPPTRRRRARVPNAAAALARGAYLLNAPRLNFPPPSGSSSCRGEGEGCILSLSLVERAGPAAAGVEGVEGDWVRRALRGSSAEPYSPFPSRSTQADRELLLASPIRCPGHAAPLNEADRDDIAASLGRCWHRSDRHPS